MMSFRKGFVVKLTLAIILISPSSFAHTSGRPRTRAAYQQSSTTAKQLLAVRGEVSRIVTRGSEMVAITVRPSREFAEVTVMARQNDLVGGSVSRESGADLLGLFAGGGDDSRSDEKITAVELQQGDIVSVIYDPYKENRALEIYIH